MRIHSKLVLLSYFTLSINAFSQTDSEEFARYIYNADSSFSVISKGSVGQGTRHAASSVVLRFYMEGLDTIVSAFTNSSGSPRLPIFTQLICAPCSKTSNIAFILGWDSYGSGMHSYKSWLIQYDHNLVSVLDWISISMPRSYPPVFYDSVTNRIALAINCAQKNIQGEEIGIETGSGLRLNLRKKAILKSGSLKGWRPYVTHPYAKPASELRIDSLCIRALISIADNHFSIDTTNVIKQGQ